MTLTEGIAVALVVIGSHAGGEKVALVVAASSPLSKLAFRENCQTRLPPADVEFTEMRIWRAIKWSSGELRVDIRSHAPVAPDSFCGEKTSGEANADSFKTNRRRIQDFVIHSLLLALNRLSQILVVRLQCADRVAKRRDLRL